MSQDRFLVVTADDFGIGPETTRGILELGRLGTVTATVMLVTSPYAEEGVAAWRSAGRRPTLGWHPCLTMDRPLSPQAGVPSLVDAEGGFHPRATLIRRIALGKVRAEEVRIELTAQLDRFCALVGGPPTVVNFHHHLHVFPVVGPVLRDLLGRLRPRPYLRRVRETAATMLRVPGAKFKRVVLGSLGRWSTGPAKRAGLPGNDWLAGITDPPSAADPEFFARWLARSPGRVVELMCHPGRRDETLLGRDCTVKDGWLEQRVNEWGLLSSPDFRTACRRAGFHLTSPDELLGDLHDRHRAAPAA